MAPASEQDEDFRRFVEAHWLGLVRSAYLLVGGDRGYAEDLVQRTLAGVSAHWHRRVRDGAPVAYVHDSLVNRAISEQRRSAVRETIFGWMAGGPPTPGRASDASDAPDASDTSNESVAPPDVVVQALGQLSPRVRAAVVLRHVDEATEAVTADVLGRSVGAVRRDTSRGLQHVHAAMATEPLARAGGRSRAVVGGEPPNPSAGNDRDGGVEDPAAADDVRRALLVATEHLSVPSDAYARVMECVASTRHRRSTIAAGCIATVVLAAVVGLAAGAVQDGSRIITPAPDGIIERPSTPDADLGRERAWPVRGALGTDPAFAAEFGRAFGADHRLLYAEDADAGQVAIAISDRGETVVFHGPSDAPVEDLERSVGLSAGTQDVTVAVPVEDGHLVIALMPETQRYAQISLPTVTGDGTIQRAWRQMPVENGVARLVTADPVGAVRLRTPVGDGGIHVVAGPFREPGTLDCGECTDSWVTRDGPFRFRDEAAAVFGVPSDDVTSRLILDATVPAAGGRIVSFVARRETGGLLRATYVIADLGGGGSTMWMVEPLRPLPGRDPGRPFVFTAQPSGDLVLVAPDASRIAFGPIGDAPSLPDVRLTDGVGFMSELPSDFASYRVFAFAADGSLSTSWHGSVLAVEDPLDVRYHLGTRAAG